MVKDVSTSFKIGRFFLDFENAKKATKSDKIYFIGKFFAIFIFVVAMGALCTFCGYSFETRFGNYIICAYLLFLLFIVLDITLMASKNKKYKIFKKNKLFIAILPIVLLGFAMMIIPAFTVNIEIFDFDNFKINFNPIPFLIILLPLALAYFGFINIVLKFLNPRTKLYLNDSNNGN